MVHLQILSGRKAGTTWSARHFPFWVGRSSSADLSLDEPAVWDRHFQISLQPSEGFSLATDPNAFAVINGEKLQKALLKNGDVIEVGLLKIRFGLTPTKQSSLILREMSIWTALALLSFGQIAIIYWLLR